MDILDDMGVSKLSAKVFLKVDYSFKQCSYICVFVRVHWTISQLSIYLHN